MSWTRSGVPLKNQMNRPEAVLKSRSFDMRAMARRRPRAVPMIIATTVSPSVTDRPRRIDGAVNHCATTGQPKFSFLATLQVKFAATTRTRLQRSQRPHSIG
jgi:hypothetical protein